MIKKSQAMSINFLVKFILAIVLFSLGVMLIWSIFNSGKDTLGVSQKEFDKRIFALNCDPSEVVCVGTNNLDISAGDNILIDVKVFNNGADNLYDIYFSIRDENNNVIDEAELVSLMPNSYSSQLISAKSSKEFPVQLRTSKKLPKGAYVVRILVSNNPSSTDDDVPKRIYVEVK